VRFSTWWTMISLQPAAFAHVQEQCEILQVNLFTSMGQLLSSMPGEILDLSQGQLPPVFNRRAWHASWKGAHILMKS